MNRNKGTPTVIDLPTGGSAPMGATSEERFEKSPSVAAARQQPRMLPTKKVAAPLERSQPQAKNLNPIIADGGRSVKDFSDLAALRKYSKVNAVQMVEVVRGIYPRYDKMLQSKCENGKKYGVQLRPDATRALIQRFAPELLEKPRKPNRKKSKRIQARLSDAHYEQLQQHLRLSGQTTQDFLEGLVARFFKPPDKQKER